MPLGVKDGEQDEPRGAEEGKENGEDGEGLFAARGVGDEAALVAEPALGDKGEVEEDGDDDGARDEEGLELGGANVANVDNGGVRVHEAVGLLVLVDDPVQEHAEEHAEPDEAGDDGEPLGGKERFSDELRVEVCFFVRTQ